jgi:hypothetical protein
MEILTYSVKQLNVEADRTEKWDENSTISLAFYDGVQFTDRRSKNGEQSPFDDAEVVFEGEVDETKITYKNESMYDVYASTRSELEQREEDDEWLSQDEEEILKNFDAGHYPDSGMDYHDLSVARLDNYYSRNNIKSNLDDDEED